MTKASRHKSDARFSRFVALSSCGWILIAATIAIFTFKKKFGINFETNITTINSYLILYQQKILVLTSITVVIALFLLTICIRVFSFKTFKLIKIILLMPATLFIISLSFLAFNLYQTFYALNIPLQEGIFALTRYIQNFSLENIYKAIATLPYQLDTIKYPLYGVIYSYLAMFTIIIIFPLTLKRKTQTLWRKLNLIISLLFIGAFATSAYYLVDNFILNDPFTKLEQIFGTLSSL